MYVCNPAHGTHPIAIDDGHRNSNMEKILCEGYPWSLKEVERPSEPPQPIDKGRAQKGTLRAREMISWHSSGPQDKYANYVLPVAC